MSTAIASASIMTLSTWREMVTPQQMSGILVLAAISFAIGFFVARTQGDENRPPKGRGFKDKESNGSRDMREAGEILWKRELEKCPAEDDPSGLSFGTQSISEDTKPDGTIDAEGGSLLDNRMEGKDDGYLTFLCENEGLDKKEVIRALSKKQDSRYGTKK